MNNQYKLYTDASRREDLKGNPMCIIAGVLLSPKNKPIMEFSIVVEASASSDELEMRAFKEGYSLSKEIVDTELVCYLDSLNSVNKINRSMADFVGQNNLDKVKVQHLSRKLNTYANALAKLPFNLEYFGCVKQAYHNLNRSKQRFYNRLKEV